jgi:hypothetical protein
MFAARATFAPSRVTRLPLMASGHMCARNGTLDEVGADNIHRTVRGAVASAQSEAEALEVSPQLS